MRCKTPSKPRISASLSVYLSPARAPNYKASPETGQRTEQQLPETRAKTGPLQRARNTKARATPADSSRTALSLNLGFPSAKPSLPANPPSSLLSVLVASDSASFSPTLASLKSLPATHLHLLHRKIPRPPTFPTPPLSPTRDEAPSSLGQGPLFCDITKSWLLLPPPSPAPPRAPSWRRSPSSSPTCSWAPA